MFNFKNSKKQGDWGMGAAIAYFTSLGKMVAVPLTDSQDYDLVVETKAGKLRKVQVKTTTCKPEYGIFQVTLKVCGGNKSTSSVKKFDKSFADYLFIVTSDDDCYLIPTKKLSNTSSLNLGKKFARYKLT